LPKREVGSDDTVAASSITTGAGAGVGVDRIAVITSFSTWFTELKIAARHAVTTLCDFTGVTTGIRINTISIITGFIRANFSVTAARQLTVVEAFIGLVFIAVVAGFITELTFVEITTVDAVSTARCEA
jgi:hypothetical protein